MHFHVFPAPTTWLEHLACAEQAAECKSIVAKRWWLFPSLQCGYRNVRQGPVRVHAYPRPDQSGYASRESSSSSSRVLLLAKPDQDPFSESDFWILLYNIEGCGRVRN